VLEFFSTSEQIKLTGYALFTYPKEEGDFGCHFELKQLNKLFATEKMLAKDLHVGDIFLYKKDAYFVIRTNEELVTCFELDIITHALKYSFQPSEITFELDCSVKLTNLRMKIIEEKQCDEYS
jgi:hypothetical protein